MMEHVGEIEKRLWSVADHLRANSNFASNEYFLPVMGLIFLRHAYRTCVASAERLLASSQRPFRERTAATVTAPDHVTLLKPVMCFAGIPLME